MTSLTTITKRRRRIKNTAGGRARKKKARNLGTTPPFPIHPEKETQAMKERLAKIMEGR
jgi:hypothetical protein